MGSSLGFLLSLFFAVQVMAYVGDLTVIQQIYSALNSVAITAGHIISLEGFISDNTRKFVENNAKADIIPVDKDYLTVGEVFEYVVTRKYEPIIMSRETMILEVRRSVMIGYSE